MAQFDIDKFFRVSTPETLPNGDVVNVRCLSDMELKARDSHGLSQVATMSEALKNPESAEYKEKMLPLDNATDASLIDTLVTSWREEWFRETRELHRVQFFPYPDNATDQERIDTDHKQKEHELTVYTARAKYVLDREGQFRKNASEWDRTILLRETKQRSIMLYALDVGLQEQIYWTVWKSVEKDGKPYWESLNDVKQLSKFAIDRLMALYREVDAQDPWALTKSKSARNDDGVGAEHSDGGSNSQPDTSA
jgi:hypothetical protein